MATIDPAVFGFNPSNDFHSPPPTDAWDQWVSAHRSSTTTTSKTNSPLLASELDTILPSENGTCSLLSGCRSPFEETEEPIAIDAIGTGGLFADLTNQAPGSKGANRSPTSPSAPKPFTAAFAENGESPGVALATMVAEMVVTPEPNRNRSPPGVSNSARSPNSSTSAPVRLMLSTDTSSTLIVEYKLNRRHRIRCTDDLQVSVNDFVIVELDRAVATWSSPDQPPVDAGIVVAKYHPSERSLIPRSHGHDVGRVLRTASAEDCELLNDTLPQMEAVALKSCHQLIHFLHLPFNVMDAEYTYDRLQVRILYALSPQASTSNAPNVSRLQRELAIRLKCKVVLEQHKTQQQQVSHPRP